MKLNGDLSTHFRPISPEERDRILRFGHPPKLSAWHTCNICGDDSLHSAKALVEHKRFCYNIHRALESARYQGEL